MAVWLSSPAGLVLCGEAAVGNVTDQKGAKNLDTVTHCPSDLCILRSSDLEKVVARVMSRLDDRGFIQSTQVSWLLREEDGQLRHELLELADEVVHL